MEPRVVLSGGSLTQHVALSHTAARAAHVPADVTAADSQVLSTMSTSLSNYSTLQIQLDGLAARLQTQSRSARQGTANHAQSLVKKFVKLENKAYKKIVALAPTVTGDPVFSALLQMEQSTHQDLLTVKTQVLPQFRLLIGATFATKPTSAELSLSDSATASHVRGHANAVEARGHELAASDEADIVMASFIFLLDSMVEPLNDIAKAPNTSCGFVGSHSLPVFNGLLDVIQVFYETLSPFLSSDVADTFVNEFNGVVNQYNAAVTRTNAILASSRIHTP
jgi:hypothetical protein